MGWSPATLTQVDGQDGLLPAARRGREGGPGPSELQGAMEAAGLVNNIGPSSRWGCLGD